MQILQHTSKTTNGELCSWRTMSKMKTDTGPCSQSKVLQLRRWQRQIFSDTISQIFGMTGEARDAVSAYTQVNMVDASKLLQVPEAHCPEIWIRIPPCQRTKNLTKWTILWFILKRIRSVTHWRAFSGKGNEKRCCSRMDWTKYRHENVYTCKKNLGLFLSVYMVRKKENLKSMWKCCKKTFTFDN